MYFSVLLIEDDELIRNRIRQRLIALKSIQHVLAGCDYAQGLQLIIRHVPKVILLDLSLPDRRGFDMIAEVKRIGITCHVIVLTNKDTGNYEELCRASGVEHFLDKNFEIEQLQEVFREIELAERRVLSN